MGCRAGTLLRRVVGRVARQLPRGDGVGMLAGQNGPRRKAEGVLIAARIGGDAIVLLGRHVARRAGDPRSRSIRVLRITRGGRSNPRDPEVRDARPPIGSDENVARLDVAVHEPTVVRRGEAFAGVPECGEEGRPVAGLLMGLGPSREVLAVDELHREERSALVNAGVMHRDHTGMGELGEKPSLANELRLVASGPAQQLDRDLAVEQRIEARVDLAAAAFAELREQHEAPDGLAVNRTRGFALHERGGQRCGVITHGGRGRAPPRQKMVSLEFRRFRRRAVAPP